MFLSRHASNPDNLTLLQAHLDSVCTGMLDKIVPLTRQQQMNTDLDDDYATHEPDDDLSIEHMRACREPPTHAPGPAIQTHPGGTLPGSPEEMLTGASFSRNEHSCVAAATPTPGVATLLPAGVGEVETTPTERTTSDVAKRARDCGVETTDVGRPIQKDIDDTEEKIPARVKEPFSKRKTAGSRKKVTKGGSSRQIKVGDHVSCASTEFDGSEPGSWSVGQKDRTFGTVTRISKEGAVMVHWDDDNTYFAVKMKSLRRETATGADRTALLPATSVAEPRPGTTDVACPYPERPNNFAGLLPQCNEVAPQFQVHRCVRRCRAGNKGQVQCSARFCRNLAAATSIAQYTGETHDSCDFEMPTSVKVLKMSAIEPMVSIRPNAGRPVGEVDGRCLCIDIKRPRLQDGFTTEHNKLLTGCVSCNTCWMCFGGGQEGKNVRPPALVLFLKTPCLAHVPFQNAAAVGSRTITTPTNLKPTLVTRTLSPFCYPAGVHVLLQVRVEGRQPPEGSDKHYPGEYGGQTHART